MSVASGMTPGAIAGSVGGIVAVLGLVVGPTLVYLEEKRHFRQLSIVRTIAVVQVRPLPTRSTQQQSPREPHPPPLRFPSARFRCGSPWRSSRPFGFSP